MRTREAIELIRSAVRGAGSTWADLGAGSGTFTEALADLFGQRARIYCVDNDPRAIATVRSWASVRAPGVIPVMGDFTKPLELPGLNHGKLDGVLLANSLHYVRDAATALARIAFRLRPGGRVVLVEYDRRHADWWVPYPIPPERFVELAAHAGLSKPVVTATTDSRYGGGIYVAAAERTRDVLEEDWD